MSQQENTPQFIKQVPWYASKQGKVGGNSETKNGGVPLEEWYERGKRGFQANGFRKGACENCGAMGHNKKQCTQRPRKLTAKYSSKNIAADDITKQIDLNWQGKRDRWNGYDADMYKQVIKQYQQYETIRKRVKEQNGEVDADRQYKHSVDPIELANLPTKHDKIQKFQGLTGVRNREDYAKYLINLDVNSDHFDPKSRSMRTYDNPISQINKLEVIGQRDELINQDRFAAEQVQLHNSELSSIALPTLTQKIYKKIKQNNQNALASSKTKEIMKKYGDTISQNQKQKMLTVIQQEQQAFDYTKKEKPQVKSRYEEDIIINDHTTVWGSWYNKLLGWGYACCHSTQKHSYCLGNKGKEKALSAQLKVKAQRLRDLQQLQESIKNSEDKQQKN